MEEWLLVKDHIPELDRVAQFVADPTPAYSTTDTDTNLSSDIGDPMVNFISACIWNIASFPINLSLNTVQRSPCIFGHFCEYIIFLFCP